MKKIAIGILMVMLLGALTGCKKSDNADNMNNEVVTQSTQEDPSGSDTGSTSTESKDEENNVNNNENKGLSDIMKQIYEIKAVELALGDIPVDLTSLDSVKYNTGLSDVSKIKDIAVSEAMIGSQAYSLVLVQVNDSNDSEAVAKEMLEGIDQRKWICVEADDLQIVAQDDVVMLFMVSSELSDVVTSQEIVDAFKEVRGGNLDITLKK